MINGAITPDLANYARDEDGLRNRDDSEETNVNLAPCPLIDRTRTPERDERDKIAQVSINEDAAPTSSSTSFQSQAGDSTEDEFWDSFSSPSVEVTHVAEVNILAEGAQSLEDGIAALTLNDSEAHGPSAHLLSADIPVLSLELADPITVGDLSNATPRPTPSPEPESMSTLRNPIYAASKEAPSSVMMTGNLDSEALIPSLEELDLGNDFLPYNVEAEPLPSGPFADRDYQNAVKAGKDLARNVADHLRLCGTASEASTQLYQIQRRAQELQRFDSPATRTIGLIGDSAVGKSSLINSLLHHPNLAHEGDHGSAVTSFVTEYRKRTHEHPEPFTIEAEYASEEEIKEQIHELLYSFRRLYMPRDRNEVTGELAPLDNNFPAVEQESEIAMLTLQSIFPGRCEVTKDYLRGEWGGTSNLTCEKIEAKLQSLAEGLSWPEGAANGKWSSTAADATECHGKVAQFMKAGLWPLTNVVRIYLSAQVLKTGIILADLPGYRDINLARVRRTEQYLFHCDEVFVVANINRVVTNPSVNDFLRSSLSPYLKIDRNVSIVCTHADVIKLKESARFYSAVTDLDATRAAKRADELARRPRESNENKERAATKYIYISARNAEVKKDLLAQYASDSGKANLNVFCVGNKDYDVEGDTIIDPEARDIAIKGSGIPELRRHCHTIVTRAQFRASNHFLEVEIPDLIQSLEVWVESAEQNSVPPVPLNCVPQLQTALLAKAEGVSEALRIRAETQILQFWRRREEIFNKTAIKASEKWRTEYHYTSYKAWVRNKGEYETHAQGFHQWNDEILGKGNQVMAKQWVKLFVCFDKEIEEARNLIKHELTELCNQLCDLQISQTLIVTFKLKERGLIYLLKKERSRLRKKLRTLEYNATGNHMGSFILTTMIPTYRECASQSGRGMEKRMHAIMARKMERSSIFWFMHDEMEIGLNCMLDEMEDNLNNHIIEMCTELGRQVEIAGGTEAEEVSRNYPGDLEAVKTALTLGRETLPKLQRLASVGVAAARRFIDIL